MAREKKRPSIGYLVPGHYLVSSAGPSRNVLSLARALARTADVTVAFRGTGDRDAGSGAMPFEVLELDPGRGARAGQGAVDDAAIRGIGLGEFARYMGTLKRFVREHDFDVVLEKSWILSGYLSHLYHRRGIPGALVENVVRVWSGPRLSPAHWPKLAKQLLARRLVSRYVRSAEAVIAETTQLERAILESWRLPPSRVEVVGLGVDHDLFQPAERGPARSELGIDAQALVLLYTGVLDRTHDLGPLIRGLEQRSAPAPCAPSVELHVVGDGELRRSLESLARASRLPVVFHGRVPHAMVPRFIAAADLCVAPYDLSTFPGGEVAYSTLKIPEYMACARPVATVPAGHTSALIEAERSGFLLGSEAGDWARLLTELPAREVLEEMGRAAAERAASITWEHTAAGYDAILRRLIRAAAREAPQQT